MEDISKSILLGVFTICFWVLSSIILNEEKKTLAVTDEVVAERINHIDETFVETLTIDYEGATN
ncbi:hypothetical protein [Maribacter sp. R77961]|jgi:hypothetical protein|uniref:hypothetical protein n=1 Tax=Maribacter sp. R77961 TaxID=3093871 RepID=UPI0037C61960